ncbi:hypothetical protein ACFS5J_12275 [Flavobacterium chuncheonense]|uniref:Lipoprotein n=1 Tax=Flavobacterium chuncheonense TaxID=2026653 RepID=A0ABW5YP67_9FLAO
MKLNPLFYIISIFFLVSCSKEENEMNNTNDPNNPDLNTPRIEITFDNQILNSFNAFDIIKIIKKNDGFIFFTNELITEFPFNTGIRISKIDNQLNLVWTFIINESTEKDHLAGVLEVENDEYISILSKMNYSNIGLGNYEVYGLKFNNSGNILWIKNYSANNVDQNIHLDEAIDFTNKSTELKIMFRSDSTFQNSEDFYFREVKINSDGDILSNIKLNYTNVNNFYNIIYDKLGNKYNFGGKRVVDFYVGNTAFTSYDASIMKYNLNNNMVFDKLYGIPRIDDYFNRILIDNNNKANFIGKYGIDYSNDTEARWIVQMDDSGNILWEIKEYEEQFKYYGKDIIQDDDGNYLSLFNDVNGYNLATLIKSNNQGEILWKFVDGAKGNNDSFSPYKVLKNNEEYLIFGLKEYKIWLKKIIVE